MYVDDKEIGEIQTPVVDEVRELMLKAAKAFEDGMQWCQGFYKHAGAVCYIGSLVEVYDKSLQKSFSWGRAPEIIKKAAGRTIKYKKFDIVEDIFEWNDNEVASKDEIIATLRAAAVLRE